MRVLKRIFLTAASHFLFLQIAGAAPLCSSVLNTELKVSAQELDSTIRALAQLRLSLDISQIQQSDSSVMTKISASDFEQKMNELIAAMNGKMSEKEIKTAIREKVLALQGLRDKEIENENKSRQALKKELLSNTFTLKNVVSANWNDFGGFRKIRYAPAMDALIVQGGSDSTIYFVYLKSGKIVKFADDISDFHTTEDGGMIILLGYRGRYIVYDSILNEFLVDEKSILPHRMFGGKINPHAEFPNLALFAEEQGVSVKLYNFSTKQPFPFDTSLRHPFADNNQLVRSFNFAGADRLILLRDKEKFIRWIDLNSGKMHQIPVDREYNKFFTSEDGKRIGLISKDRITFIKTAQLADFQGKAVHHDFNSGEINIDASFIGRDKVYIGTKDGKLHRGIYNLNDLSQPIFIFDSEASPHLSFFNIKANQAFFMEYEKGQIRIEQWVK